MDSNTSEEFKQTDMRGKETFGGTDSVPKTERGLSENLLKDPPSEPVAVCAKRAHTRYMTHNMPGCTQLGQMLYAYKYFQFWSHWLTQGKFLQEGANFLQACIDPPTPRYIRPLSVIEAEFKEAIANC